MLNGLGEVLLATGRNADARRQHAGALSAATQVGEKCEQAGAHDGLASVFQDGGGLRQARCHWREALSRNTELGAPEADEVSAKLAADNYSRPRR